MNLLFTEMEKTEGRADTGGHVGEVEDIYETPKRRCRVGS